VESLFDLSRITNGRLTLQREWFDLTEAVREVVNRLAEVAALASVAVTVEAHGEVDGLWDRLRIEQIVENLLSNAIKYAACEPITVTVSTYDDMARITVADRGPGIANDDLQRIFGRFERAMSTLGYGGLGLGLYIAHEYTAAHGGTIAVTSSPGDGATFAVELPRSFAAMSPAAGCCGPLMAAQLSSSSTSSERKASMRLTAIFKRLRSRCSRMSGCSLRSTAIPLRDSR
jgi:two-component system OmpR family sensor kinase